MTDFTSAVSEMLKSKNLTQTEKVRASEDSDFYRFTFTLSGDEKIGCVVAKRHIIERPSDIDFHVDTVANLVDFGRSIGARA